ncbi:MAG: hypothetical protein F6K50_20880 [Moorea sp. SIO3I7]|uniref:hypothetical protein n=1 Tax=Moorena sp. SIO4A5 TaxID=2607838 RepID=UPI0013CABC77|nr:hypothetical protein [Moorena sp. SIO4A5]NEN97881.1 hypothetical protein [Moorena sp. SIO3I7]NEO24507.1 hypothetical protein [Moorena sp. SIO4A5]NEQ61301.1 hypothetical protein [Moorena sp. SIO4A1]
MSYQFLALTPLNINFISPSPDSRLPTPDSRLPTPDSRLQKICINEIKLKPN